VPRLLPRAHHGLGRCCGALALLAAGMAHAGDPAGNAPVLRGPQLLLYVQLPIGHTNQPIAMYGLRLEQSRLQSGVVPTTLAEAPYHQQLLDIQLRPHADMQIAFARRVTWDFGRESFAEPSKPSSLLIRWPLEGRRPSEPLPQALISGWPQMPKANPSP
jgi:hypothetical protein